MPHPHMLRQLSAALIIAVSLSACASVNTGNYNTNAPSVAAPASSVLTAAVASQLEQAQEQQTLVLANSPWGNNISMTVTSRYFAATGQPCLRLQSAQQTPVIVCQFAAQRWVERRAITEQFSRAADTAPMAGGY